MDSLDLGLHVDWGTSWLTLGPELAESKLRAAGTAGLPWRDTEFFVLPSGKAPIYCFHLQSSDFHIWIQNSPFANTRAPNVYVSIASRTLWQMWVEQSVAGALRAIGEMGGTIRAVVPSRCDLTADYLIPGGLSYDMLRSHAVTRARKFRPDIERTAAGDQLQTLATGERKSPTQLRLYDKALEVRQAGTKLWFLDVWELDECLDVWRIEYQLRRTTLREFGIHSIDDLLTKIGGLWRYLTTNYFSLRLPDNPRATRRSLHPWWQDVVSRGKLFGPVSELQRERIESAVADTRMCVSQVAGQLTSYAARKRIADLPTALALMSPDLERHFADRDFSEEVRRKQLKL